MNDELESQLRELGHTITAQLDESTVHARREHAVRSAMTAKRADGLESRWSLRAWCAELFTPRYFAPAAAFCLLLLGVMFVFQDTRNISSVMPPAVSAQDDESPDELADEVSLVAASLVGELEAEFENEGVDDGEDAVESLSFSEDDFDTEEDFSSEDGTESI